MYVTSIRCYLYHFIKFIRERWLYSSINIPAYLRFQSNYTMLKFIGMNKNVFGYKAWGGKQWIKRNNKILIAFLSNGWKPQIFWPWKCRITPNDTNYKPTQIMKILCCLNQVSIRYVMQSIKIKFCACARIIY